MYISFIVVGLFLAPQPVASAEAPSLARFVPADVQFFGNWRATPEQDRLLDPSFQAMVDLVNSGIGKDIFELATMEVSEGEREEARQWTRQIIGLITTPKWLKLAEKEVAVSFRLAAPIPEYLIMFRVTKETAAQRRGEFRELFAAISQFAPENLAVKDSKQRGADVSRLDVIGAPIPVALSAASKADLVILSTSEGLLDKALALMDSEDGSGSVAKDPRFSAGLEGLGGSENAQIFFDLEAYIGFFKGMLGMAALGVGDDKNAAGALSIAKVMLDELSKMSRVTTVERTNGDCMTSATKVAFKQDGGVGVIEESIRDQEPLRDFYKLVPVDSKAFFMTAGLNPLKVYDGILNLIKEKIPAAGKPLAKWERIQKKIGISVRDDLLSWIDGGCGCITLPGKTTGQCGECVFFMRIKDSEKAEQMIYGGLELVGKFLESRGLEADLVAIEGLGDEFKQIQIDALPWFRPVIGLPQGSFVVASSADAVKRVGASLFGQAPDFTENPAYAALGVPDEPLTDVFYQNTENSLEGLANLASGAGFVASILPRNRDTRPVRKLGKILLKLSKFLRDIDIVIDRGGWARYDEDNHVILQNMMIRVRPKE